MHESHSIWESRPTPKEEPNQVSHESLRALREHPHLHIPRLVRSSDLKGTGLLDVVADGVSAVVGDMRVFLAVVLWIAVWLVAGTWLRFDPSPFPLLLMLMNIPQLPIMISLQVSANRAEKQRDAKGLTDHETLTAIHALAVEVRGINQTQTGELEQQTAILRRLDPGEKP